MSDDKDDAKSLVMKIRIAQAVSAGIFTFGLSSIGGDVSAAWNWPISPFSLTTTMFGAMGILMCEIFARRFDK